MSPKHASASPKDLPYRPCVGVALFNRAGLVWIGQRVEAENDAEGSGHWWQMPQGGLDAGEAPEAAAFRELHEETSVEPASVSLIKAAPDWLYYDLPAALIGKAWGGRYRGQKQMWFALRFTGDDADIDVHAPGGGGHEPEFSAWRWERLENLPALIVPFKRGVYQQVVEAFSDVGAAG